jgi:hypothetical protein
VTEASANVAEAYGVAKNCRATVGDAFMGLITRDRIAGVRVKMVPMKDSYLSVR